ncbi:MAG: DNA-directed polymerase subunit beta, partial [Pseudonocardiales bacterium]|nr:DNA-directed polymerase subunit beta [Pseudonocardiales bacterium]
GIQAFEPQLVEGKAIQIHPLVCTAFNADFDGDQMAVHVPLSAEAQAEARILMLSTNNILKPADGRPVTMPTQDMILGLYHLTTLREHHIGAGNVYGTPAEALMASDARWLDLQAPIRIRLQSVVDVDNGPNAPWVAPEGWESGSQLLLETTLGRTIFNDTLPSDYRFVNYEVTKKELGAIVNDLAERYPKVEVAQTLDALKAAGFHWATRSGITIAIDDVVTPPRKAEILERYEADAEKLEKQYQRGAITGEERRQELVEVWTKATAEVAKEMEANFPKTNPVWVMVNSGARGNMMQMRQIAGMRGLVANPKGEIIPRPIKANFREGLSVLEYFISTHGARKGLADTALRTADSGYLTRRLVDVSQDVIIREEDCGTDRGVMLEIAHKAADGTLVKDPHVETSAYARVLSENVKAGSKIIAHAGDELGDVLIEALIKAGTEEIKVRSVLTCESAQGTCATCYGRSLATGKLVDVGEAVGIIAAQSIGEPGTQLTMRTFHTGGIAGDDITHGLPRVAELFEARVPKGVAPISEATGNARIEETETGAKGGGRKIVVTPDDGTDEIEYPILRRSRLLITDGQHVEVGQQMVAGAVNPHDVLRIMGPREVQLHLVREVQSVYRSQGVGIHDKHIEVIVRQMLKRITVIESGASEFLPGSLVERAVFESENRRVVAEGAEPASGRPVLMGITKASLATESWLSAASFQETTRVLTDAAISAKSDSLLGLKENVIIGKLIPAGTGIARYRNVEVAPTEEARAAAFSMAGYDESEYYGFGQNGGGQAVPLEEYGYSDYR